MKGENKIAIIIVVFNISNLISTQIELIKYLCKDNNYDIIVIDNSHHNKSHISEEIKNYTINLNCLYDKVTEDLFDFSQSHAFACNYAYNKFQEHYEYMFFLDHDNFPIANFSVKEILVDKIIGGVGQSRITKDYFWPGCVMFNNKKISKDLIDFSINRELGLDTGGQLYQVIDVHGKEQCVFFDQLDVKNTSFAGNTYNFYNIFTNIINAPYKFSFMHFINASNWNNKSHNNDRINSLLKILHGYAYEKIYERS